MTRNRMRYPQPFKHNIPALTDLSRRSISEAIKPSVVSTSQPGQESNFNCNFSQLPVQEMNSPIIQQKRDVGLPDRLKTGIERLSGISLDDVTVHYNSSKPAQMQAVAYAQGSEIHVSPNQERHLPHEAWHIVQQRKGRVKPTGQLKGQLINDDSQLEKEADVMGSKAIQMKSANSVIQFAPTSVYAKNITGSYSQGATVVPINETGEIFLLQTASHPKGKVNYDAYVKAALKKEKIVPKSVADEDITLTGYDSFGRRDH